MASIHNYTLQLWVCTSRYLNLYKLEQMDTHVLHDILHVFLSYVSESGEWDSGERVEWQSVSYELELNETVVIIFILN